MLQIQYICKVGTTGGGSGNCHHHPCSCMDSAHQGNFLGSFELYY